MIDRHYLLLSITLSESHPSRYLIIVRLSDWKPWDARGARRLVEYRLRTTKATHPHVVLVYKGAFDLAGNDVNLCALARPACPKPRFAPICPLLTTSISKKESTAYA
eukprot:84013-Pyramimonas_sp.AAC.2